MGSILLKIIFVVGVLSYFSYLEAEAKGGWTKETYSLQQRLIGVGYSEELSRTIIDECKSTAKDARNCVIVASFVGKAESNCGRANNWNNVFGVIGKRHANKEESVKEFVKKYNKFWYNQRTPDSFYSSIPNKKPKTYYCLSEHSSKSLTHCPNGSKNAWNAYRRIAYD